MNPRQLEKSLGNKQVRSSRQQQRGQGTQTAAKTAQVK